MTNHLTAVMGSSTLVQQVQEGREHSKSVYQYFFPITALQCRLSRGVTDACLQTLQWFPCYQRLEGFVQRTLANNYSRCEKPLIMVEKVSRTVGNIAKKTASCDPFPYSEALIFIQEDIATAAQDLRTLLTLEPKLLQMIDKIELIAREEIIDFLKTACETKINHLDQDIPLETPATPAEMPASSETEGWFGSLRKRVTRATDYVYQTASNMSDRVTSPIKHAVHSITSPIKRTVYEQIPTTVENGVTTLTNGIRTQLKSRREDVEKIAIPKATNILLRNGLSFFTFFGVNTVMNQCAHWMTNAAVHSYFHDSTPEEIDNYSTTIVSGLYYSYYTLILISYTARIAAWKRQRIHAQATGQFLQDRIGDPVAAIKENESVRDTINTIVKTFQFTIANAGEFLEIDITSAVKRFTDRCEAELQF